jgi:tetratricopeptide (TPR) repeat protein
VSDASSSAPSARLLEALDGYLRALEAGEAPDRDAVLARHPDLADELGPALDGLDFVHRAGRSLAAPADAAEIARDAALGDYRLVREIGRGGMAVVYEAEQVSLGRRVALKVLPFAAVLDPRRLQRFRNEALAAAHLRHPHIVPVISVGCERGVHYYAMQYVEGQSLAVAIREMREGRRGEGPRTPISDAGSHRSPAYVRLAAQIGRDAAEALDHAHHVGVVHRDVKPGNLLVDGDGTVWVADFGLARTIDDVGMTRTGELLGTVRYMSPEQALARRSPVDHRTDVYSLGATLYELLTLEPAFPGDDVATLVRDVATKEPVPPRRINPAIPRDVETVVLKAMSKEASARYATAQEMADDLARVLADEPVRARRPTLAARAGRWSRRNRRLVAGAFLAMAAAIAGLIAYGVRVGAEQRKTETALGTARRNLEVARQAVDKYLVEAGTVDLEDRPLPHPARRTLLETALRFYEAHPDERAAISRANVLHELHRYEEALRIYDGILSDRPDDVDALVQRGHMLWHLDRDEEARADLERAIRLEPDRADAHDFLGTVLLAQGKPKDALDRIDRAIELGPTVARYRRNRGAVLHHGLGKPKEALDEFVRAADLDPTSSSPGRGDALVALGRHAEAKTAFEAALVLEPECHHLQTGLGNALYYLGAFDEALAAYGKALTFQPGYAWALLGRGNALGGLGRHEQAAAAHREAIESARRDTVWSRGLAEAHCGLGNALLASGDPQGAIREYRESLAVRDHFAPPHSNLATVLWDMGEHDEAIRRYLRAIEIDPNLADARLNLGICYEERGELDKAIAQYRDAIGVRPSLAIAHVRLGSALLRTGELEAGLSALRKGHEVGSKRSDWTAPSASWVSQAERLVELDRRLPGVLSGETRVADVHERMEFADVLYMKRRHVEAARMFADAFAEAPSLVENLTKAYRYNAACNAALAAAGGGAGAADLRAKALDWLRADLDARAKAPPEPRAALADWRRDSDLASVRDRIDDLPEGEREAWRRLWADLGAVLGAEAEASRK